MGERVQSYIVTFLILPIEVLDFVTIHRVGLGDEWIDISKFIFLVIPVSYLISWLEPVESILRTR
jgi:hypothetical protein